MRKKICGFLLLIILAGCQPVKAPEFDLNPVIQTCKCSDADYGTLEESALLVVKVKVLDKVSVTNSVFENDNSFYSTRQLEVLEIYKNETEQKLNKLDKIQLKESSAVSGRDIYFYENHIPLQQSTQYVLYLTPNQDHYLLLHGDMGVINVDSFLANTNINIMANFMFKYLNPQINGKTIEYKPLTLIEVVNDKIRFVTENVKFNMIEFPIEIAYGKGYQIEYIRFYKHTFKLINEPKK